MATWPVCDTKANPTLSNTQPGLPIGSPLLRHTLSQGRQGLEKLSGCTAYLDRWRKQETGLFPTDVVNMDVIKCLKKE